RRGALRVYSWRKEEIKRSVDVGRSVEARLAIGSRVVQFGATRRFVACSNAYPSSISRASLHAIPVNETPNGAGFAVNPSGNDGVGALGTKPNGTITVGYPGLAASAALPAPGKSNASRLSAFIVASIPSVPARRMSFARSAS